MYRIKNFYDRVFRLTIFFPIICFNLKLMKTFKIIVIVLVLIIGAIITLTSCRESVDEGSYGIVDSISAIIAVSITMYLIVRAFTVKNKPHH